MAVGAAALKAADDTANVAIGAYVLCGLTTGTENTVIGSQAGEAQETGDGNTAIGFKALESSVSGNTNTALGICAGNNITTGNLNVAIGPQTCVASATGSCQLAIGIGATFNWLTGDCNKNIRPGAGILDCCGCVGTANQVLTSTATGIRWVTGPLATPTTVGAVYGCLNCNSASVGFNALKCLTTGTFNAALGENAGCKITTGCFNVAIGRNALCSETTGNNNVAIGNGALSSTVCCQINNVAVGNQAGFCSLSSGNVFIGAAAGGCATTGFRHTLVGEQAGACFTTGSCITALGWNAGYNITTGSSQVIIGPEVASPSPTCDCQLAIGVGNRNWLYGNQEFTTFFGGNVIFPAGGQALGSLAAGQSGIVNDGLNTPTGGGATLVLGNSAGANHVFQRWCNNTSQIGFVCATPSGTIQITQNVSDYRLKENLTPLTGASDDIRALPIYQFNYIKYPGIVQKGFLAHELAEFVPEAVSGVKDEIDADGKPVYQGVDYAKMVPMLTAALKESIERIDILEKKVAQLESGDPQSDQG